MEIQFDSRIPLGQGGYGSSVFPGTFQRSQVAVKEVRLINTTNDKDAENFLMQLNHPNIVKLLHFYSDNNYKYFALELCKASLDQIFLGTNHPRKYKGPDLPHHSTVFLQLAEGMEYMHSKNFIHRDIKPRNVLISVDSTDDGQQQQITMKWADFGLSKSVFEREKLVEMMLWGFSGIDGIINWLAPELLKLLTSDEFQPTTQNLQKRGTVKSDVYALALVFAYLILDGHHLYGSGEIDIPDNIIDGKQVNIGKIDPSHYALKLMSQMLKYEQDDRISSGDVVIQLKSIKQKLGMEEEFIQLCSNKSLDFEKFKLLIQSGIDLNGKDKDGKNALHLLCILNSDENFIDAMKLLIQFGIDVNGKDKEGNHALNYLCYHKSNENLIGAIKLLIQNGIDVNGKNIREANALHGLCENKNSNENLIDAIKLLIQNGIEVNGKCLVGGNALHSLCCNKHNENLIDAIKLLIQFGIDVNEKNLAEENALHKLCGNNSKENLNDLIKLLIQLGIDANGRDGYGRNALHILCNKNVSEKLYDTIKLLIEFGIDVNVKNNGGRNALHSLCESNTIENIIDASKLFIELGIDVHAKDNEGNNVLHLLCRHGYHWSSEKFIDAINLLIQFGIDVHGKDNEGKNVLHFLCQNFSVEIFIDAIKLFIELGVDVVSNGIDARKCLRLFR